MLPGEAAGSPACASQSSRPHRGCPATGRVDGRGRRGTQGEPRVAAECTYRAREFGRCSRPTVRPGRTVHDARDHGDGSDTCPCGRRTSGSLTETRVRDWQSWPDRFDGSADRHMTPCPLGGTDQLARHVLAACIESDGPVDADGDQARVIDDARHPAFLRRWCTNRDGPARGPPTGSSSAEAI